MGVNLYAGGLMDQPYIWIREYKVCCDLIELFERIRIANLKSEQK